jgi:hypothetical protein
VVAADAADARAMLDSALVRQAREAGVPPPPVRPADETEEIAIDLGLSDEFPLRRRQARRTILAAGAALAAMTVVAIAIGTLRWTGSRRAVEAPAAVAGPTGAQEPSGPTTAVTEAGPEPSSSAVPGAPAAAPPRPARAGAGEDRKRRERAEKPPGSVAFEPRAPSRPPRSPRVDTGLAETLGRKEDATVKAGLPPDLTELQSALDARRGDLERCAEEARGTSAAAPWAGLQPQIVVTVQPGGQASARIDDATLEATDLAACLRRVVARTAFPAFRGDPVELRTAAPVP